MMRRVYDLFAGNCYIEDVLSIGDRLDNRAIFYANLYVGLYFEVNNKLEQVQDFIVKAATECKIDDYMWYLAQVHQKLRN